MSKKVRLCFPKKTRPQKAVPTIRHREYLASIALASATAMALSTLPGMAIAQTSSTSSKAVDSVHTFSIPSQPLGQAITALSKSAGIPVSVDSSLIAGRSSPVVQGTMTVRQALQRMLAGSGLTAEVGNSAIVVRQSEQPGSVSTMATVNVVGDTVASVEAVNPPTTVGSKTPLTQREIPQTVSVITQQQIQDQNLWRISDVLKNAPGVTTVQSTSALDAGGDAVYSRGWQITNYNIDGIPTMLNGGLPISSTAEYERVELLHGASGIYNGLGGAGGTINVVRKQPQKDYAFNSALSAGTNDSYQGQVDATGSLNEPGTLRGRGVVSWQRQGYDDGAYTKTGTFYGVLEADIAPQTTAQIGASYDATNGRPERGLPTYADGSFYKASRSDYHYPNWNRFTNDTSTIFGNITHQFDNGWTAKVNAAYLHTNWSILRATSSTAINSANQVFAAVNDAQGLSRQLVFDTFVDGPFQLFGRTHHLTLGTNYSDLNTAYQFRTASTGYRDFEDLQDIEPVFSSIANSQRNDVNTTDYGAYVNARFSLADPLTLVLGGRLGWYETKSQTSGNNPSEYNYKNKFTPSAGLIYDINKTYSAYTSYSTIYMPATTTDKDGNILKPLEGDQYEIGLKGTYLDGRANASVALFRGTQKNRAVQDPSDPTGLSYLATGKARVQGVELLMSGEVLTGLTLSGGYTYLNTRILDDNVTGTAFSQYSPKHMLKLWADYKLPGELNKWRIGGGATVISPQYVEGAGYQVHAPGYALFDALVGYQLNPNLRVDLSVKNLFDRYYWSTITSNRSGNFVGQGRTVMLTLRASY